MLTTFSESMTNADWVKQKLLYLALIWTYNLTNVERALNHYANQAFPCWFYLIKYNWMISSDQKNYFTLQVFEDTINKDLTEYRCEDYYVISTT